MSNGSLLEPRWSRKEKPYITNPFYLPMRALAFERVPGPIILDCTITGVTGSFGYLMESNEIPPLLSPL